MRAQQGYVEQQIELAAAYLSGRGVEQDVSQAVHWYKKAAQSGDPEAQNLTGYFYQRGIGVRADVDSAARWFQLSAASGLTLAKVNLAVLYLKGLGVRKNPETARKLLLEAAERGDGLAAAYLGNMEYFGTEVARDPVDAERWFERGVKLHDGLAAYDLACLYLNAPNHEHDLRKAADLMRMAAGKGYVRAMSPFALLLLQHPEFAVTANEPVPVLQTASEAGNWLASMLLGVLARDGRLIDQDPAQAYYYFWLAALQGGAEAEKKVSLDLKELAGKLPAEELQARTERAEGWTRSHPVQLSWVYSDKKLAQKFPLAALPEAPQQQSGD